MHLRILQLLPGFLIETCKLLQTTSISSVQSDLLSWFSFRLNAFIFLKLFVTGLHVLKGSKCLSFLKLAFFWSQTSLTPCFFRNVKLFQIAIFQCNYFFITGNSIFMKIKLPHTVIIFIYVVCFNIKSLNAIFLLKNYFCIKWIFAIFLSAPYYKKL